MPLDPEFEPILAMMGMLPPFSDEALDALRHAQMGPPVSVPVASVEDFTISAEGRQIGVRLYKNNVGGRLPVIVFFHGGGFVIGGLESHDAFCRLLCNGTGAAVVAVDYRLAPEHRFPAAPDDTFSALCWVHANADRLGLDAARMLVAGDSAGGNLAAVTALRSRDESGPALLGQVLICPLVEFFAENRPSYRDNGDGPFLTAADIAYCTSRYLRTPEDAEHPYAAPMRAASLEGLPPAYVITAEYDPLRDEGEAYAAHLAEAGNAVQVVRYDRTVHDFVLMQGPAVSARALDELCRWISARFGGS